MKAMSISASGLSAGYGPTVVLEDISFNVPAGQCAAVIGRNGMGKTTLMASLMGLTKHLNGTISIDGEAIENLPTSQRALQGIAYVPQTRDVFPTLTVEENLFVGLKGRKPSQIDEAYALFPRLAERRQNLGSQLSGGEQQMLSVARGLLGQPSILLLDEPLEGLAPVICQELMSALATLMQSGNMTTLLVEQHVDSALEIADLVLVLERGILVWSGTVDAWRADTSLTNRYLGVSDLS